MMTAYVNLKTGDIEEINPVLNISHDDLGFTIDNGFNEYYYLFEDVLFYKVINHN